MTVRIAEFVHATQDVMDEAFLGKFPEIEVVKANNIETPSDALEGAEIFQVYNSAFTPEFAQLVRDKGQALKWIQFTTVGIDIALKARLPNSVWVTNSGDVNQRVLAGHVNCLDAGRDAGISPV
jgi:phosphoglycerate dehydrogenase-like enzyme